MKIMNDIELEVDGKWWLPTQKSNQLSGILTFDNTNGGILSVAGNFLASYEFQSKKSEHEFIILGESINNKKITLVVYNITQGYETLSESSVYSKRSFKTKYIFIGHHFKEIDEIKFEYVFVEYSNLNKWIKNFDSTGHHSTSIRPNELKFEYSSGDTIDIIIDKLCSIQIMYRPNVTLDWLRNKSEVYEKLYVKFSLSENKDLGKYIKISEILRDFLNFVISEDVITLSFTGFVISEKKKSVYEIVEIISENLISDKMDKEKVKTLYLLQFEDIKDNFQNIISSWFDFIARLRVIHEFYFSTLYNSHLYIQNRFLMIVTALEVYHGKIIEDEESNKEQEETYTRILSYIDNLSISKEDLEQLKKWISNGRLPSLSNRIKEIYEFYSEIIPYLSIKIEEKECFARKVKNYRNDLSHGNINNQDIDEKDLFWTYKDLQLLLRLCILSQLGFTNNQIKEIYHVDKFKEIMESEKKRAFEILDTNTETAYLWSTDFTKRCDFPPSLNNNPDFLLNIIKGVDSCIKEIIKPEIYNENSKELLDLSTNMKSDNILLNSLDQDQKQKLLNNILSVNKQYMQNLENKEILGISLALWSGCISSSNILKKDTNGGPNMHIRELLFSVNEKLCSERPIYGKGVELALLWKLENGNGNDIDFSDATHHFHIRKYENLCRQRLC